MTQEENTEEPTEVVESPSNEIENPSNQIVGGMNISMNGSCRIEWFEDFSMRVQTNDLDVKYKFDMPELDKLKAKQARDNLILKNAVETFFNAVKDIAQAL